MKEEKNHLISSIFNRNKFLFLIPILILSLFFIPFINAFAGGDGTPLNPYQISNCTELQSIDNDIYLNNSFILLNNIDCSDTINWNGGLGFEPIGNDTSPFSGIFDGNNYNISDLFINRSDINYTGLFAWTNSLSEIFDIGLINVTIYGNKYVGGLVARNYGLIANSYATGNVNGFTNVGGLVGLTFGGIINNSYTTVNVNGVNYVGGLVGFAPSGTITNSYATGNVNGSTFIGGLVGYNYGAITNSYTTGNVNGSQSIGGLVGTNSDIINNSYATGNVGSSTSQDVGGLVGTNSYGTINNSYATGNVNGYGWIGGLVGTNYEIITNSYATGNVNGYESVGGLVGDNVEGYGIVTNSFYDSQTSGQSDTGKGIPKTTIEMMDILTFSNVGWDIALIESWINEIWFINNTYDYPRLSLLLEEPEPECYINEDCLEGYICEDNICIIETYPALDDVYVNKSWEGTENNTLIEIGKIYGYNAFSTITEGINVVNSGGVVYVASGTYNEAIYINKDLSLIGDNRDTTFIYAPDIIPYYAWNTGYRPIIAVDTSNVLITGFTIDGLKKENTNLNLVGVHFWKSSGDFAWNKITGIRDEPFSSGNGVAIWINHEWDLNYCHSVNIINNIIEDYQKGGIVINEPCANAFIYRNTITGYGETDINAQNGIQIGYGLGVLSNSIIQENIISKHYNTGADYVGTGILLFGVSNITINNNTIFDNENGIDLATDLYYGSGSSINIGIKNNILTDNCKGIKIRPEGNASYITNNSISQLVSESCFMIDNWDIIEAPENYWGTEYPVWENLFSNYTIVDINPYYLSPEMEYLGYVCEVNGDCLNGYECIDNFCILIPEEPTPISDILGQVGAGIIVIFIIFFIFVTIKGRFSKK